MLYGHGTQLGLVDCKCILVISSLGEKCLHAASLKGKQDHSSARPSVGTLDSLIRTLSGSRTIQCRVWGFPYKLPIEKQIADLQWRLGHGVVAENRNSAHLDHGVVVPFCSQDEIEDIYGSVLCYKACFALLESWFQRTLLI